MGKLTKEHQHIGGALMQVINHDAFLTLTRLPDAYAHFAVYARDDGADDWRHLFVKFATRVAAPHRWRFAAADKELSAWSRAFEGTHRIFLALVCTDELVCVLNREELDEVMGGNDDPLEQASLWQTNSRSFTVEAPPGKQCRVTSAPVAKKGRRFEVRHRIRRTAFPGAILGRAS